MSDNAQKIKSILGEFISKNALSDGIDTARIQENWSSIMGENITLINQENLYSKVLSGILMVVQL